MLQQVGVLLTHDGTHPLEELLVVLPDELLEEDVVEVELPEEELLVVLPDELLEEDVVEVELPEELEEVFKTQFAKSGSWPAPTRHVGKPGAHEGEPCEHSKW